MEVTLSAPHGHTGGHSGPASSTGLHHSSTAAVPGGTTASSTLFAVGTPATTSSFMLPVMGHQFPAGSSSSHSSCVRPGSRSGQALVSTLAQHVASSNNSPNQTPSRTRASVDLGRLLPPRPGLPPPAPGSACRRSLEALPTVGGQSQSQLSQSQLFPGQPGSLAGTRPPSMCQVQQQQYSSTVDVAGGVPCDAVQTSFSSTSLAASPSRLSLGGPSRTTSNANNLASMAAAAAGAGALPEGGTSGGTPVQPVDVLQSSPSVRLAYGEVLAQQGRVPWSQLPGSTGSIRSSHSTSLKAPPSGNQSDPVQAAVQGSVPTTSATQQPLSQSQLAVSSPHTSSSQLPPHMQPQPPSATPGTPSLRGPRTVRRTSLELASPSSTWGGAVLPAVPSGGSTPASGTGTPTRQRTSLDSGMRPPEPLGGWPCQALGHKPTLTPLTLPVSHRA
jgi:hypothetical protein